MDNKDLLVLWYFFSLLRNHQNIPLLLDIHFLSLVLSFYLLFIISWSFPQ
jgi:hypothetical protein